MKKQLIFAAATVIGVAGGLYLASSGGETPTVPVIDFTQVEDMREGDMLKLQLGADRGSDVVFTHEDGAALTLAAFEGKFVVLNFWATWCRPCRLENPKLVSQYEEFNNMGFEILNISIDKDSTQWKESIKKDGLLSHQQILDVDLSIYKLYSLSTLPANFLLDNSGRIIAKNISTKELGARLSSLLSEID